MDGEPVRWGPDAARSWVEAAPRARWSWWTAGVAVVAFVVAAVAATPSCTPADPCNPDVMAAVWLVVLAASVVLLPWFPLAANLFGLLFAASEVLFGDPVLAKLAFTAYGSVCVAHALYTVRCRNRQRRLAGMASTHLPAASLGSDLVLRQGDAGGESPAKAGHGRRATIATLVLLAGLSWLMYEHEVATERQHLKGSVLVWGTVLERINTGYVVGFTDPLDDSYRGVEVDPSDDYADGADILLQIDPDDRGWLGLYAEPADPTLWISLAVGLFLLAGALAMRTARAGGQRRSLIGEQTRAPVAGVGVPVRVMVTPDDDVALLARDGDVAFARFSTAQHQPVGLAGGRTCLEPVDGYLVGDLRSSGWAAALTATRRYLPEAPLRAMPELAELDALRSSDEDTEVDPRTQGKPVSVEDGASEVDLPWDNRPPIGRRLLGVGVVLAAFVATAAGIWWLAADVVDALLAVFLACPAVLGGLDLACTSVRIGDAGLRLSQGFRRQDVPSGQIGQVRRDGNTVIVVGRGNGVWVLGPFRDGWAPAVAATLVRLTHAVPRGATATRLPSSYLTIGSTVTLGYAVMVLGVAAVRFV